MYECHGEGFLLYHNVNAIPIASAIAMTTAVISPIGTDITE